MIKKLLHGASNLCLTSPPGVPTKPRSENHWAWWWKHFIPCAVPRVNVNSRQPCYHILCLTHPPHCLKTKKKQTRKVLLIFPVPSLTHSHATFSSSKPKSYTAYSLCCTSLTSSNLVCLQGKEKVKPRGNFFCINSLVFMKSARQSATYSNSCREEKAQDTGLSSSRNLVPRTTFEEPPVLVPLCHSLGWFHWVLGKTDFPSGHFVSPLQRLAPSRLETWILQDPEREIPHFLWKI